MVHPTPNLTTPIIYPIGWLLLLIWFGFIGVLVRRMIRQAKEEAAKKKAQRERRTRPRREEA